MSRRCKFGFIYRVPAVDFFNGLLVEGPSETADDVINELPDEPRDGEVYKFYVPMDDGIIPVYLCKGDNNGDTYLFSHRDWLSYLTKNAERV